MEGLPQAGKNGEGQFKYNPLEWYMLTNSM
jgi:hypothetical protein